MIELGEQIRKACAGNLIEMKKALSKVTFQPFWTVSIKSKQLNTKEGIIKITDKIPLSDYPVIYKFTCSNLKDLIQLLDTFKAWHANNKILTSRVDRVNMARWNKTDSLALYVGSTRCLKATDFRSRIKQHLGGGNSRTYAMQLSKWHEDLNYTIVIQAINVIPHGEKRITPQLLELIEQSYWDEAKPVFGKKAGL